MRYYIVAGERSGDLHASNLVKALKKNDSTAEFRGFGGEYMEQAGVELAVHYRELAFMGLAEIITNANKIKKYIRLCKEDILTHKPDVIISSTMVDLISRSQNSARKTDSRSFTIYPQSIGLVSKEGALVKTLCRSIVCYSSFRKRVL
jgi:lipid-A-disaccharide synthase